MIYEELDHVLREEGFRSYPYQDHLGNWTFGHGLTWISEAESKQIVQARLLDLFSQLSKKLPWFAHSHPEVQGVLVHMAYQLGVAGLMNFKKTMEYLKEQDYASAADEMLDSKWAEQTPERAHRTSERIRALC